MPLTKPRRLPMFPMSIVTWEMTLSWRATFLLILLLMLFLISLRMVFFCGIYTNIYAFLHLILLASFSFSNSSLFLCAVSLSILLFLGPSTNELSTLRKFLTHGRGMRTLLLVSTLPKLLAALSSTLEHRTLLKEEWVLLPEKEVILYLLFICLHKLSILIVLFPFVILSLQPYLVLGLISQIIKVFTFHF